MRDDNALFGLPAPRLVPGRVRRGLDRDIAAARDADVELAAAGVATLRTLADQIDQLERLLRSPEARPYDRIPLTGLVRQFDDTYGRVFAGLRQQTDPIARALADFMAAEAVEAP
jgi:hypothetical protein